MYDKKHLADKQQSLKKKHRTIENSDSYYTQLVQNPSQ